MPWLSCACVPSGLLQSDLALRHSDVSSVAAAANTEQDRRGVGAAPPLSQPFTHPGRLTLSTSPVRFEILFYLNSLPVTRIF